MTLLAFLSLPIKHRGVSMPLIPKTPLNRIHATFDWWQTGSEYLIHEKKSAPKIIFEIFFCLETYKGDPPEEGCEVSSAPVVKLMRPLLPKNTLLFPDLHFYFLELSFYFLNVSFSFLELPFCFPEVLYYLSKNPFCFPELRAFFLFNVHISFQECFFFCSSLYLLFPCWSERQNFLDLVLFCLGTLYWPTYNAFLVTLKYHYC